MLSFFNPTSTKCRHEFQFLIPGTIWILDRCVWLCHVFYTNWHHIEQTQGPVLALLG